MTIKNLLASLSVALILSGCSTMTEVQEVKIPVYVTPKPPSIEQPQLPIDNITPQELASSNAVGILTKKYVISLRLSLNYIDTLKEIINTYDRLSEDNSQLLQGDGGETTVTEQDVEAFAQMRFRQIEQKYNKKYEEILNDIQ